MTQVPAPAEILISRLLRTIVLVITASAVIVYFIALPFDYADQARLLPNWSIFNVLLIVLIPIIVARTRAGIYFLGLVALCEVLRIVLNPTLSKIKTEAAIAVGLCVLSCLWFYLARHFHFH